MRPYTTYIVSYSSGYLRDNWNRNPNFHKEFSGALYEAKLNSGGLYFSIKKVLMVYKPDKISKWKIGRVIRVWHYYPGDSLIKKLN